MSLVSNAGRVRGVELDNTNQSSNLNVVQKERLARDALFEFWRKLFLLVFVSHLHQIFGETFLLTFRM